MSGQRDPDLAVAWVGLNLVLTVLFVFIYSSLRRMLSGHLRFDRSSGILMAMIGIFVAWFVGDSLSYLSPVFDVPAILFTLVFWFALGIGHVALGIQWLKLRAPSAGLATALAWTSILTGICTASIVLILVSVPCVIVFDILMAVLFLKVAERPVQGGV